MFDSTKEIVIAMINNGWFSIYDDIDKSVQQVNNAIKSINQQVMDCKLQTPNTTKD